jgi:hypothetical protein
MRWDAQFGGARLPNGQVMFVGTRGFQRDGVLRQSACRAGPSVWNLYEGRNVRADAIAVGVDDIVRTDHALGMARHIVSTEKTNILC